MAILTGPSDKGRMVRCLEKLRVLGGVGIVAVPAVDHRGIDLQVSLDKGRPLKVMALSAEGLNLLVHQGRLSRSMRLVASQTIPAGGRMDLFLSDAGLQVFMAVQAEVRASCQEEVAQF